MPISATDIVIYGSANMPDADGATTGGAIDTSKRIIPSDSILWNALADTVEAVSSNAGDTSQTVTVYGRLASGVLTSEVLSLNGTVVVNGATTFARIEKIVINGAHAGTVTVRKATGDTTLAAMETGLLEMRRPFYNVSSDASGGSSRDFYEKVFAKNTHATKALLAALVKESSDPEGRITFCMEDAVDDNNSVASRLNTAPSGMEGTGFSSSSAGVAVPGTNLLAGTAIGIWLKLTLPAGQAAAATTYTLNVTGSGDA